MESIKELLKDKAQYTKKLVDKHKYVTKEFQDFGYRLALKLGDLPRVSMYIKLAKLRERALLEQALSFASDYPNAKNKGRLFMWKLKQLEEERKKQLSEKEKESANQKSNLKKATPDAAPN